MTPRRIAPGDDPARAIAELAGSRTPWLFGVRHHSPACAAALPALLERLDPTVVAVELPEDLAPWLPWLGHAEAEAPLAVAGVSARGEDLGFYPFADFSPELVAIRWAFARGVPVRAIDLPMGRRAGRERTGEVLGLERMLGGGAADSWEHLVEAPAAHAEPERVRRAALLFGWALRVDAARGGGVSELDRAREAYMRGALGRLGAYGSPAGGGRVDARADTGASGGRAGAGADTGASGGRAGAAGRRADAGGARVSPDAGAGGTGAARGAGGPRVAAIVGAFHAAALLEEPRLWTAPATAAGVGRDLELISSLVPYGFELLDERSGYPAGIRDPAWQQRLWEALRDGGDVSALVAACLVEITREIRRHGLPASVPDAHAAASVAASLASLRRLAAPGRRELVEAVQTALAQGELLGRGRVVARAMEHVLVGRRRGRLAPGTPRSGLAPHVLALLDELRLPHDAMLEPTDLRLDPLRSPLDRRRHVALCRLRACGIPYGTQLESIGAGGLEALTTVWRVMATPATEAMIELAGLRGVTLRQAAAGALRAEAARLRAEDKLGTAALLRLAESAAEAGAPEPAREWLAELAGPRLAEATLPDLLALLALLDRIAAGHVVGLPADRAAAVPGELDAFEPPPVDRAQLLGAAVASIVGLAGSDALADARALAELVHLLERHVLGEGRLRWSIQLLVDTGTPLIAGAASVVLLLIGARTAEDLSITLGGWFDAAASPDGRRALARRLHGALAVAGPLFEAAPVFLDDLVARVERVPDADFLPRVPSLREGFDALSTAARRRLLRALGERLGDDDARGLGLDVALAVSPAVLLAAAAADRAGRASAARVPRPALALAPAPAIGTVGAAGPAGATAPAAGGVAPSGATAPAAGATAPAAGATAPAAGGAAPAAGAAGPAGATAPAAGGVAPAGATAPAAGATAPAAGATAPAGGAAPAAGAAASAVGAAAPAVGAVAPAAGGVASGAPLAARATAAPTGAAAGGVPASVGPAHTIHARDRWRLILGHEREALKPRARAAARSLDELYGHGHGEGSRDELSAGTESGYPTVREWRDEIEAAFGAGVYEEVAAKAAVQGRAAALLELDPDQVTPSIELLEQVLSLKGGLGETYLGRLRALVRRIVDDLVGELAVRVRPALHGAVGPRATRRPTGALHLARTVAANLARARVEDGVVRLLPERLIWRARSRRHLDWHVALLVDVSGSMEPSVIYSAMMAAILSAVPWIDVRFVAFSTEVVDLSAHAGDPLSLLLEISVGGGTHIAKALRYVRGLVQVPQRTIAIVVSDFEEGSSVDALLGEVRELVESGVTCLGLAALDDRGAPRYAVPIAEQVVAAGMPIAALDPVELARWIGEKIR